ncbi:MAG: hypothetical protein NC483_01195 [Ruminococcus sp.]|nr:hypothetical protein [Ruminococcus sp.]
MRQTIGGTWLMQLMILFILLFVGYIVLTLSYSKSIRLKNEVVTMVEKYNGLHDESVSLINNYLSSSGYTARGNCTATSGTGVYGATDLKIMALEEAQPNKKYYYCVKKFKGANTTKYYQVTLFYKFNLPILGNISGFTVRGTTSNFQTSDDDANSPYCKMVNENRGFCRR